MLESGAASYVFDLPTNPHQHPQQRLGNTGALWSRVQYSPRDSEARAVVRLTSIVARVAGESRIAIDGHIADKDADSP